MAAHRTGFWCVLCRLGDGRYDDCLRFGARVVCAQACWHERMVLAQTRVHTSHLAGCDMLGCRPFAAVLHGTVLPQDLHHDVLG